jgi:inner membrane protein
MTAKGHVLLALPLPLLWAIQNDTNGIELGMTISLVVIASLAPDIDEPNSWIGKRARFLSIPLKLLGIFIPMFRHRGATHIFFIPFLFILFSAFSKNIYLASFSYGWMMHTIGDLLTKGGINGYLYPFFPDTKVGLLPKALRFYTGSLQEIILINILVGINALLFFKLIY